MKLHAGMRARPTENRVFCLNLQCSYLDVIAAMPCSAAQAVFSAGLLCVHVGDSSCKPCSSMAYSFQIHQDSNLQFWKYMQHLLAVHDLLPHQM